MKKWGMSTWLGIGVLGFGLILTGVAGLFVYISNTATPLHPNAQDVPSRLGTTPVGAWAEAAEQGRQIVRADLTEQNLPGVSVAVGVGGELVWAEGFGWADLENRKPVAAHTRFRIGTASVALTSAAVGLLVEKGRLNLDAPIQSYVPSFPQKQWPVTARQLMTHMAGMRTDGGDEGPLFGEQCDRPADAVPHIAGYELLFEPGTAFRYSSYAWILVSAAVEAAAQEPFLTFMRARVFEPLGMADTKADSATEPVANMATPYFPRFAADPRYGPDLMRPLNYSCYAGSSAFVSTSSDLVRFGMAMSHGALLQPATTQLLQTSQRLPSGEDTGYGLGWNHEMVTFGGRPTRVVGHNGDVLGGQTASLLTFPDLDIVVSIVANTSYADTFRMAVKVAEGFAARVSSAPCC